MDDRRNGGNGSALLPELPLDEAEARYSDLLNDIRAVLRVPFIDPFWLMLLQSPNACTRFWRWLAPLLGSYQCENAAAALRREAAIPLALGLPAHKAFRGDMSRAEIDADGRARISNYTMASHYVLPKLLLAAVMLRRELLRQPRPEAVGALAPLPRGVAPGAPNVAPLDPDRAFGELPALFAAIRAAHGHNAIAAYYRTVALAGDFLRIAWNAIKPIVGDPIYDERVAALISLAADRGDALRAFAEPLALSDEDTRALLPTLTFHADTLFPQTLVELTVIKGLLDGPDSATRNRYSLVAEDED